MYSEFNTCSVSASSTGYSSLQVPRYTQSCITAADSINSVLVFTRCPCLFLQLTVRGCCDATLLPRRSSSDELSPAAASLDYTCGSHRPQSDEGRLIAGLTLGSGAGARGDAPHVRDLLHDGRNSSQLRSQVKTLPGAIWGQAQF